MMCRDSVECISLVVGAAKAQIESRTACLAISGAALSVSPSMRLMKLAWRSFVPHRCFDCHNTVSDGSGPGR